MLVLKGLVGLHRTVQLQLFSITGLGIGLDYHDIEWFPLETNRDHSVIFEILVLHFGEPGPPQPGAPAASHRLGPRPRRGGAAAGGAERKSSAHGARARQVPYKRRLVTGRGRSGCLRFGDRLTSSASLIGQYKKTKPSPDWWQPCNSSPSMPITEAPPPPSPLRSAPRWLRNSRSSGRGGSLKGTRGTQVPLLEASFLVPPRVFDFRMNLVNNS